MKKSITMDELHKIRENMSKMSDQEFLEESERVREKYVEEMKDKSLEDIIPA